MVGEKLFPFILPNSRGETKGIENFLNQKNMVIILLRDIH